MLYETNLSTPTLTVFYVDKKKPPTSFHKSKVFDKIARVGGIYSIRYPPNEGERRLKFHFWKSSNQKHSTYRISPESLVHFEKVPH